MSFEDELRDALRRDADRAPAGAGLDADAAVARSRARRRPRVAIAGGVGALAGIGVLAIAVPLVLQPLSPVSTSDSAVAPASSQESAPDGGAQDSAGRTEEPVPLCGLLASDLPDDTTGASAIPVSLGLEAAPLPAEGPTLVTVVLTSTATEPVTVQLLPASDLAVVVDGIVVGLGGQRTGEDVRPNPIPLQPGESVELPWTVGIGCDPAPVPPLAGPAQLLVYLDVVVQLDGGEIAGSGPVIGRFPVEIGP